LRSRILLSGTFTLAVVMAAPAARADDTQAQAAQQPAPEAAEQPSTRLESDQRKDPAQFRGRTNYETADEPLSWIPRIVLFPLYLVSELILRVPSVGGAIWMDRNHVVPILDHIMNPTPDIHWGPILTLDLGRYFSAGLEGRLSNVGVRGHEITGSAETSGTDGGRVKLRDSWKIGPMTVGARGTALFRNDLAFYGFGPYSKQSDETYFSDTRFEGFGFVGYDYRRYLHLELSGGFRDDTTGSGFVPSINGRFWGAKSPIPCDPPDPLCPGAPPQPVPGLNTELGLAMAAFDVRLDTRRVDAQSGGLRALANATYAQDVRDSERSFISTTLDVTGAVEVSRPDRVLSLRGYLVDTFPLGDQPVPFTEQAMLGWANHFGFHWGRFRDEAAVMAELRYRYPIAYFLDMQWIASVGNVFSRDFNDFDFGALTTTLAVGLRTRKTGRTPIELILGLGTTRFNEAFDIQSVRLYLSTTEGL